MAKFMRIFDKVRGMIPLNSMPRFVSSYGDENFFPSAYYVHSVTSDHTTTRVLLEPPRHNVQSAATDAWQLLNHRGQAILVAWPRSRAAETQRTLSSRRRKKKVATIKTAMT